MEIDPQEQVIVDLLAKLKNADGGYPKKLMASRRHIYLNQIANIGLGLGIGAGLKNVVRASKGGATGLHIPASSLFETMLVAAIIIETGIAAYTYKDKFAELFTSFSSGPKVEEVAPIPVTGSSLPEFIATDTLTITALPTGTPISTGTSIPTSTSSDFNIQNDITATPSPKDDNGNHFGQTPKPERTKVKNTPRPTKVKENKGVSTETYNPP